MKKIFDDKINLFLDKITDKDWYINFVNLIKIAEWSTHKIYKKRNINDFTIKINKDFLIWNIEKVNKKSIYFKNKDNKNLYLNYLNNSFDNLDTIFWENKHLKEKAILKKIIFYEKMIFFKIKTIIIIQEYLNFNNLNYIIFETQNEHKNIISNQLYEKNKNYNLIYKDFDYIIDLINNDNNFKNIFLDFLLKYKDFFDKHSELIDIIWNKNIIFFKKNKIWDYKIWSVIKDINTKKFYIYLNLINKNKKYTNNINIKNFVINYIYITIILNYFGDYLWIWKIINLNYHIKNI